VVVNSLCSRITQVRQSGVVRCNIISEANQTLQKVAAHSGLKDTCRYFEINRKAAYEIAVFVLTVDLAYRTKISPIGRVQNLVSELFALFSESDTRCFTNIASYIVGAGREASFVHITMKTHFDSRHFPRSYSWDAATNATFDLGVIMLGNTISGVLWVEDED
jgi:hypothetical protein